MKLGKDVRAYAWPLRSPCCDAKLTIAFSAVHDGLSMTCTKCRISSPTRTPAGRVGPSCGHAPP